MEEIKKMEELNNYLSSALAEYKTRGKAYAEAYKNYRVLLSQELLKLKAEGMPVTIAYDIARGTEQVAKAKEQEIITECLYKSCQEAIKSLKNIAENAVEYDYLNWEEIDAVKTVLNLIQKQDKIINNIKFITYNNKPHITQEKLIEYFKKEVENE